MKLKYILFLVGAFSVLTNKPIYAQSDFDFLVWSDEFDGTGAIDTSKWHHQTLLPNGVSWFNGEIQHYTNRTENSYLEDGNMVIMAKKESFTDQGQTKDYTSARLNSKFAFTYGRVEVRAKLPTGIGTWPAIWMLGKNISEPGGYWEPEFGSVGWPACGEIDIMEHWGTNQNYVQSAIHTPSSFGGTVNHGGKQLTDVTNTFHIYALEWDEEKMVFSVDGDVYYTYNPPIKNADTWPFDADQYMLLNIAVQPSIDPQFNESPMVMDYVRIYQKTPPQSVEEVGLEKEFMITPNPADSEVVVNWKHASETETIRIFSLHGVLMDRRTVSRGEVIDISAYPSGVYTVRVDDQKPIRIIKQ